MTQRLVVNCTTGEQTLVDYTPEEEAAAVAAQEAMEAQEATDAAAAAQKAEDKASGEAKLKDLGLSDDEIAAITS